MAAKEPAQEAKKTREEWIAVAPHQFKRERFEMAAALHEFKDADSIPESTVKEKMNAILGGSR